MCNIASRRGKVYLLNGSKFELNLINMDDILIELFYTWSPYKSLLAMLKEKYGIKKSLRWLKIQFRRLGLSRRPFDPPVRVLRAVIRSELATSNQLLGYRGMWQLLRRKYRLVARRDTVMRLLREEDPAGCERRKKRRLKRRVYRNKGPNYMWHIDGYDKLSPFGFTIHGCIDGFSRKIIWLHVATSNSNPKVIARYYLESTEKLAGCPLILRSDYGTENCALAGIHIAYRYHHNDDRAREKSFLYGPSTSNIKIEGWWSQLRRRKTHWWINLFKTLAEEGHFHSRDTFHRSCLAYSMINPLKNDLEEFVDNWNAHLIRRNRLSGCPGGVPNHLYDYPSLHGSKDYSVVFDVNIWLHAMFTESESPSPFYSEEFKEWADYVIHHELNMTQEDITQTSCRNVYLHLISH